MSDEIFVIECSRNNRFNTNQRMADKVTKILELLEDMTANEAERTLLIAQSFLGRTLSKFCSTMQSSSLCRMALCNFLAALDKKTT